MSAGDLARALEDMRAHTSSDSWRDESEIDSLLQVLHADEHASAHWGHPLALAPRRRFTKRGWRGPRLTLRPPSSQH
jgi:hypothetical protein